MRVVVFDSNALNPYGAELAEVLADAGYEVTRWCRVRDPFPDDRVRQHRVLWASRCQVGLLGAVLSRYWGVLLFVLVQSLRRNDVVVMTWLQAKFDLRAGLFLIWIGRRVVYIDHNPLPARPLPAGSERLMARMRRSAATRVVHTQYLHEKVRSAGCFVARHPSYLRWVNQYGARAEAGAREPRALFLGALRKDKGADDLPSLGRALRDAKIRMVVAGRGVVPGMTLAQMQTCDEFEAVGSGRTLSDQEIASQLRSSMVLLAPYRDVTMSGSIMMALSAGVPVAAYPSEALKSTLPQEFFVETNDPDDLADLARQLVDSTDQWRDRLDVLIQQTDRGCAEDWRQILSGVS
ncbi:glycosyltransferase [Kineosporia sp. J2-2]|uniref:Glycosyltransferase n=1 Tax=Kineosporia corallincola TaxID=2835133 RepID=A0ABS5TEJ0_9ACTN|nr:glycosyltransferase [Kineosporia corallincola]MBT0769465.1 glycosyltransferase [Kineosporia corallincola]